MEDIQIRMLKVADTDDIAAIYSSIVRKPSDDEFKTLIAKHAERSKKDVCLVAEIKGRVVGFVISYILTFGFGIEKSAWIATLGVDIEYMGQGIGARLVKTTFKRYQEMGINRIYTSVIWDSTDMLSFFKSLGFGRSKFINLKKDINTSETDEAEE
ncbi:GCN5-related N-acetyltransferase [Desulfosarcina cetonica]|uniref:GNAT family N-acetyltransferase n=1 Tax=Desulfosarcina cetonica TaxID=90730 RepID=UPI0006D26697|nr:GNAT family N-acetyltransferase [Desulfosarcina cetonica]VTR66132.1 GCN5-related N-acetyltransferase [Desulfosarcina cetonica]